MPYRPAQLKALLRSDLIPKARVPSPALRICETVLRSSLFRIEDDAVVRQLRAYRVAFEQLRTRAAQLHDERGMTTAWRDGVTTFATERLHRLGDTVAAEALRATAAAYEGAYYGRLWLLDMTTRAEVDIRAPRVNVLQNVLKEDLYDDLIQSLLGREWRERYALEMDDLIIRIRRALGEALANGDSVDSAMRRVRDAMGVDSDWQQFRHGRARITSGTRANFNRIQVLTRTVIQTQANNGTLDAYRANADILNGYEWLTARDERVCPVCRGLDGTIYRLNDSTRPPAHVNCRCTTIPVIAPDAVERGSDPPRETLDAWMRGYGMDAELARFRGER